MVWHYPLLSNSEASIWYRIVNSGRKPQVVSAFNSSPAVKSMWRNFAFVFQRHSWAWQIFIVGLTFVFFHIVRDPILAIYQANNTHRGYKAAITKEKAYKKKMRELEEAEEAAEAAEE